MQLFVLHYFLQPLCRSDERLTIVGPRVNLCRPTTTRNETLIKAPRNSAVSKLSNNSKRTGPEINCRRREPSMIFPPEFSSVDNVWGQRNLRQLPRMLSYLGFSLSEGDRAEAKQGREQETSYTPYTT